MALSLRKSCNPSLHRTSAIGELRKWQSLRAASPASPRRHSVPHLSTKLRTLDSFGCLLYDLDYSMPFVVGPPRSHSDILRVICVIPTVLQTGENAASPPRSVIVILF